MRLRHALWEVGWWLLILFGASLLAVNLLAGVALVGHDLGWWS